MFGIDRVLGRYGVPDRVWHVVVLTVVGELLVHPFLLSFAAIRGQPALSLAIIRKTIVQLVHLRYGLQVLRLLDRDQRVLFVFTCQSRSPCGHVR